MSFVGIVSALDSISQFFHILVLSQSQAADTLKWENVDETLV